MQSIPLFQVDTFTDKVFHGNPAAICLLSEWFNDELLQAIAIENQLSETAFVLEDEHGFHIRWFTPNGEVSLCGHATLAAGFVLFELGRVTSETLHFSSLSGSLYVHRQQDSMTLNFPLFSYEPIKDIKIFSSVFDQPILEAYDSPLDYLIVLSSEHEVMQLKVNHAALERLPKRGAIVTARSEYADFYSRCFYPRCHLPEDPVTGSAHCVLTPYWAQRLNKARLEVIQGAARRGELMCELEQDRVRLSGKCCWYSKGYIYL